LGGEHLQSLQHFHSDKFRLIRLVHILLVRPHLRKQRRDREQRNRYKEHGDQYLNNRDSGDFYILFHVPSVFPEYSSGFILLLSFIIQNSFELLLFITTQPSSGNAFRLSGCTVIFLGVVSSQLLVNADIPSYTQFLGKIISTFLFNLTLFTTGSLGVPSSPLLNVVTIYSPTVGDVTSIVLLSCNALAFSAKSSL